VSGIIVVALVLLVVVVIVVGVGGDHGPGQHAPSGTTGSDTGTFAFSRHEPGPSQARMHGPMTTS
jgi:hypothetical protein